MTDRIIDAVADLPKVCEHFNIPVQSGDDRMLERMRRGYTVAEYEERLERIRIADAGGDDRHRRDRGLPRRDRGRVPEHRRPAGAAAVRRDPRRRLLAAAGHVRVPQAGGRRAARGEEAAPQGRRGDPLAQRRRASTTGCSAAPSRCSWSARRTATAPWSPPAARGRPARALRGPRPRRLARRRRHRRGDAVVAARQPRGGAALRRRAAHLVCATRVMPPRTTR